MSSGWVRGGPAGYHAAMQIGPIHISVVALLIIVILVLLLM